MHERLVASLGLGLCFVFGSAATPAAADALDSFLARLCSPAFYQADDFHPEFAGSFTLEGNTTMLDRARVETGINQGRQLLAGLSLKSLEVLDRSTADGVTRVDLKYRCRAELYRGLPVTVKGRAIGKLVPGGPSGYQWLHGDANHIFAR